MGLVIDNAKSYETLSDLVRSSVGKPAKFSVDAYLNTALQSIYNHCNEMSYAPGKFFSPDDENGLPIIAETVEGLADDYKLEMERIAQSIGMSDKSIAALLYESGTGDDFELNDERTDAIMEFATSMFLYVSRAIH